jgi:putative ABC transport system permease protein
MDTVFGVSMNAIMIVVLVLSVLVLAAIGLFAWRNPIVLNMALRNIPRRRAQTVLIVFGLMLATLLITAAFGTGDTITYSMRQAFTGYLGGTDLQVTKPDPGSITFSSAPIFNRPVPTFDTAVYEDLRESMSGESRIDGWSAELEQVGPLANNTTRQGAGQTFIVGVGRDMNDTVGALTTLSGGRFDVADLRDNEIVLDEAATEKLAAKAGHEVTITINGKANIFTVRETVGRMSPSDQYPVAYVTLSRMQEMYGTPGQITTINVSLANGEGAGLDNGDEVAAAIEERLGADAYTVEEVKKDQIEFANLFGNLFTTIFLGTALFSIAAGVLLIFLIFTMLAAERKSEMGMARAVGMQRRHLTQMFVFEGMAYDLAAAAVGAALGVGVGFLMVGVISGALGTFGFRLLPHIEIRSIIVAYCLGMLVTFLTVFISAVRVSRLNIVSAIRDIPEGHHTPRNFMDRLTEPFDMLASGQVAGCIGALASLIFAVVFSGPVAVTFGVASMVLGWVGELGFYWHLGATLLIVGLCFSLRWVLARRRVRPVTRNRIAFTIMGVLLVAYWALPVDTLHDWFGVPEFGIGIEYFFIAGLAMVAGAVLVVIYNSDILLGFMTLVLGRVGRLRPVLMTAVAYPMSATFRTGMAIAMFALIMFVLILMSVLTGLNQQIDPNKPEVSGGYQIEAPVSFLNPVQDIDARIAEEPSLAGKFESVTGQVQAPLQFRQIGAAAPAVQPEFSEGLIEASPGITEGWRFYNARLVDDEFLRGNQFVLQNRAEGYDSDRAVWEAVQADPTLVVVDSLPVLIGQAAGMGAGGNFGPTFYITGVDPNKKVMQPVELEARMPGAPAGMPTMTVKVIGVLSEDAQYYNGVYANRDLAGQVLPPQMQLPTSLYFFRVKPGENVEQVRLDLGSAFLENGMEPVIISDTIREQQAASNSLNGLLQGFMALGLLVGVAALGVISTRAVVERRQQIGVLRAIGYQRGMVGWSFVLESSFIALLGILIGVALGLVLSYNFVQFIAQDTPTVEWSAPWLQIGGIVLLAYVVSLLTTIMPARQASQIYPAEALRYE